MNEFTLTTPALLFSAISLIMLAYTNRFLGYAALIRDLYAKFQLHQDEVLLGQIANLRRRLYLTKTCRFWRKQSVFVRTDDVPDLYGLSK